MTPYDTEVIVPHSTLWSHSISNATSGNRSLLCVADFYLHPDHDAAAAQRRFTENAVSSSYRKADTPVAVIVQEKARGTHYKLKDYVKERSEEHTAELQTRLHIVCRLLLEKKKRIQT